MMGLGKGNKLPLKMASFLVMLNLGGVDSMKNNGWMVVDIAGLLSLGIQSPSENGNGT